MIKKILIILIASLLLSSCFLFKKDEIEYEPNEVTQKEENEIIDEEEENIIIETDEKEDDSSSNKNNINNSSNTSNNNESNNNYIYAPSNNTNNNQIENNQNNNSSSDTSSNANYEHNNEENVHEHTIVIDEAIEPTCTEDGLTSGIHCEVCGEIIVAQEKINALGHSYGNNNNKCIRCNEDKPNENNDIVTPKVPIKKK